MDAYFARVQGRMSKNRGSGKSVSWQSPLAQGRLSQVFPQPVCKACGSADETVGGMVPGVAEPGATVICAQCRECVSVAFDHHLETTCAGANASCFSHEKLYEIMISWIDDHITGKIVIPGIPLSAHVRQDEVGRTTPPPQVQPRPDPGAQKETGPGPSLFKVFQQRFPSNRSDLPLVLKR